MDDPEFESRQPQRMLVFFKTPRLAVGPIQPPIEWVPALLSPVVERSGPEFDHAPPSATKDENKWSPLYAFLT